MIYYDTIALIVRASYPVKSCIPKDEMLLNWKRFSNCFHDIQSYFLIYRKPKNAKIIMFWMLYTESEIRGEVALA